MKTPCIAWPASGCSLAAFLFLAACNTAGELPQGPVTPIVPPAGAAATRSAQPTSAPAQPGNRLPALSAPDRTASIVGTLVNGTPGAQVAGQSAGDVVRAFAGWLDRSCSRAPLTSDAGGQFVFDQLDASTPIMYGDSDPIPEGNLYQRCVDVCPRRPDVDRADHGVRDHDGCQPLCAWNRCTCSLILRRAARRWASCSSCPTRATAPTLATDGTSVRFPLPPGATNVQLPGWRVGRALSVGDRTALQIRRRLRPAWARRRFLSRTICLTTAKSSTCSLPMAYPVKSVNVLVPEGGVKLTSPQLTAAGSRQTQGGNMVNFVGGNLAAGAEPGAATQRRGQLLLRRARAPSGQHESRLVLDCRRGVVAGGRGASSPLSGCGNDEQLKWSRKKSRTRKRSKTNCWMPSPRWTTTLRRAASRKRTIADSAPSSRRNSKS